MCLSKLDGGLGFRNLEAFNLALLAKQLWRLLTRWCIGTGHSINLWKDPWLPGTPFFRAITPNSYSVRGIRVCDLILEDMREWSVTVVNTFFWPEDQDIIMQIPLSFLRKGDIMIWHCPNSGVFSVRSAYRLALSKASPVTSSSGNQ
ncbi:UNVERIFIED_CONTAM: hypothetical protein Sangu_1818500 [Sesamum angustifolium]|uniref:Reverse transcriptase zinc-binding domain-containing protein n=1 Tax=Sesamum angustifolium TaxID=2727405 RepID=A0AAW2M7M4_9LAMI